MKQIIHSIIDIVSHAIKTKPYLTPTKTEYVLTWCEVVASYVEVVEEFMLWEKDTSFESQEDHAERVKTRNEI